MPNKNTINILEVILFFIMSSLQSAAEELPWITMYLPSYYQNEDGSLIVKLNNNDFEKITHLSHHGPYVNKDGSFNYAPTHYSDIKGKKAVEIAHSHNIPILLCIVSWKEYLNTIETKEGRHTLVKNTIDLMDRLGYDGVDIDLEPVVHPSIPEISKDNNNYILFVKELYDSLQQRENPLLQRKPLLTTAVNGVAGMVLSQIYELYDQINLMTYDMSQPWEGWPVWHDSAIKNVDFPFPDVGDLHSPSVELDVKKCTSRGIPNSKIGIGVSGDAFQWKGGKGTAFGGSTEPLQTWTTAPTWIRFGYKDMMENVFKKEYYRWDDKAKMSYLSIDNEGSENDEFWSYNDERSCFEKMNYVKENGLGGVIIWEIGNGYLKDQPADQHLPQLDALYRAKINLEYPIVYKLEILDGTGTGEYEPGTIVKIIAAKSDGKIFANWDGDVNYISDVKAPATTLIMPKMNVMLKAIFKNTNNLERKYN